MREGDSFLVSSDDRPSWVEYPRAFLRLVEQRLVHITPWHVLDAERALARLKGLRERFPSRALFPFAYRQDNDDVACWAKDMGERTFIIHDFASAGFEDEAVFENVWSWFRAAIEDTIAWD
jgi:hypothetical protein